VSDTVASLLAERNKLLSTLRKIRHIADAQGEPVLLLSSISTIARKAIGMDQVSEAPCVRCGRSYRMHRGRMHAYEPAQVDNQAASALGVTARKEQ